MAGDSAGADEVDDERDVEEVAEGREVAHLDLEDAAEAVHVTARLNVWRSGFFIGSCDVRSLGLEAQSRIRHMASGRECVRLV